MEGDTRHESCSHVAKIEKVDIVRKRSSKAGTKELFPEGRNLHIKGIAAEDALCPVLIYLSNFTVAPY